MVSLISGRVPALNGVFFWCTLLCLMHFPKLALILSSHLQKNQKYYNRKHAHWMIKMCKNVACSWLKNVEKKKPGWTRYKICHHAALTKPIPDSFNGL